MARKTDGITKKIEGLKEEMIGEVFSPIELDNIMGGLDFYLIETEDDNNDDKEEKKKEKDIDIIKYTNHKTQIWIEGNIDDDNNILVSDIKRVNNINLNESTETNPFRSYDDFFKVINWFKDKEQHHHWLCAWLCFSLGRRVGDIVSLKWSDFYLTNGNYREKMSKLREEKTGKIVGVRITPLVKMHLEKYCEIIGVNPMEHYNEKIFNNGSAAFRKMLKRAVDDNGFTYAISTHSFRRFYGNTLYLLHPNDANNIDTIQAMFGQSDPKITRRYIGAVDEKIDTYANDLSQHTINKLNGVRTDISNSPVVSFKSEDFREILSQCWEMAKNGEDKFEGLNEIISVAEGKMV